MPPPAIPKLKQTKTNKNKQTMKGFYLINTDNWFYAPDGKQYKAVWGNVQIIEDSFLGIKTNRNSSNWFARVGTEKNHVIIAGCQIHYAVKCERPPVRKDFETWEMKDGNVFLAKIPNPIYFAK